MFTIGDVVKIDTTELDDENHKIGFIGAILHMPETMETNQTGEFSVYGIKDKKIIIYGDYAGEELIFQGKQISKKNLIECIEDRKLFPSMADELQKLLKKLYEKDDSA